MSTEFNWFAEEHCPRCYPHGCDCEDAERPEAVDPRFTPLRNRGCHCGADYSGRDCMCFEGVGR